jgi:hypothetical protein
MEFNFELTGFNKEYWSQHSESEFIAECLRDGILSQYGPERTELLKLVYKLKLEHDIRTAQGTTPALQHKRRGNKRH